MSVELNEALLSKIGGWEALKRARAYLQGGQVLSSNWTPPVLKGVVQDGTISFRAGLVIKNSIDVENLCTCRPSREWGTICAHSIAVGLHHLRPAMGEAPARVSSVASVPPPARVNPKQVQRTSAGGEPAELFIVFPPNIEQALARGKIMLCFEARTDAGRGPINALPRGRGFTFSAKDATVLDKVEALAGGETPAMLMLEAGAFSELLPALVDHPGLTIGRSAPVTVSKTPWMPPARATLLETGEIQLTVSQAGPAPVKAGNWIYQQRTFQPMGLASGTANLMAGPVRLGRSQVPMFLNQEWPRLVATPGFSANFKPEDFSVETVVPKFMLELTGGLARLTALLQCAYGPRILTLGQRDAGDTFWMPDPENSKRYLMRDQSAEQAALARLLRAGFTGPDGQGRYQLAGQTPVLNFFAREYPRLQREWQVTLEERLDQTTRQTFEYIQPKFEVTSSGVQWFDLAITYSAQGGEQLAPAEIQRLLLSGQGHTRLRSGKIALVDTESVEELQQTLLDCAPQQHSNGYRLAQTQAGFLEATIREHAGWQLKAPAAWQDKAGKLGGRAPMECPPLGPLESVLRPYQKTGVAWMRFLRQNGFGGVLADEMGLGKTLQTLALLQAARDAQPDDPDRRPWLIVCPTSLVFNWCAEAAKFTPRLRVLTLHGPERHGLFSSIPQHDLVLTSYALARRDADRYREFEFDTMVLDEAQHIKNRQTQNAQAVKAVRARHRLVLTGTPLENSVLDLWSIFDFLMPGYLGGATDFKERYEIPITRHRDGAAQARLARRLRPFLLRRLKREVAPELPERIEQVAYCELAEDQRALYQQVLDAGRREVMDAVGTQGLARSRMVILTALLRLRQICCDPRMLKLEGAADKMPSSGKTELFGELLDEIIDGGHRVLVFSQFVSMLTLLREHLDAEGTRYCYLDGSTQNRGEVVRQFQSGGDIPVFLISLKAGGVGLNLTAADTVIHFDPWWNPAVEDQATGRAHRIGQTRLVTSYKLITRNTVEDKILELQRRKREIMEATLGGEEPFTEALSWEEIQELFAA